MILSQPTVRLSPSPLIPGTAGRITSRRRRRSDPLSSKSTRHDRSGIEVEAYAQHKSERIMDESELLEPGPSTARTRHLIIVAQDHVDLWRSLKRHLVGDEGVEVILDRRQRPRREAARAMEPDRRRADRRHSPRIERSLNYRSLVIVCLRDGKPAD